jgi:hypothetical protein
MNETMDWIWEYRCCKSKFEIKDNDGKIIVYTKCSKFHAGPKESCKHHKPFSLVRGCRSVGAIILWKHCKIQTHTF